MHIFSNNTLAEYTNHLETALEIEKDEWEVGLCEIQYPQAWDNVRRGSNKFTIATNHHAQQENGQRSKKRYHLDITKPFPSFYT